MINSALNAKYNTIINKNTINITDEKFIRRTFDEFHISHNTSSFSSSLNQQDVYLSIYDTQKIYTTKDNKILLKNKSMIIDPEKNRNSSKNKNKNKKTINKSIKIGKTLNNNINHNGLKKLDNKEIKVIKNVINRLNEFLRENTAKEKFTKNNSKNNKNLSNKYDFILKNSNRFLKEIHINKIKRKKK